MIFEDEMKQGSQMKILIKIDTGIMLINNRKLLLYKSCVVRLELQRKLSYLHTFSVTQIKMAKKKMETAYNRFFFLTCLKEKTGYWPYQIKMIVNFSSPSQSVAELAVLSLQHRSQVLCGSLPCKGMLLHRPQQVDLRFL